MERAAENFSRDREKKIFNLSYLVLAVLILLTLGVTYSFNKSAKNKDLIRFNNQTARLQASLENRINLYTALLNGGKGFIETTPELSREAFANYVKRLNLQNNYSGVQGIGFTKLVKPDEREELVNRMKSEGYADFRIFPEEERDLYHSIIYLEPLDELNRKAIGFDMFTEARRREAMERARDTGEPAMTAKVILVQEGETNFQSGFLIYLPVYRNGQTPASVEQRRENLIGYIYSPFRANDFLNEIYKRFPEKDLSIKIYDREAKPENLLAQSENRNSTAVNFTGMADEKYLTRNEMQLAGRTWIVEYDALPTFAEQSSVSWTPLILLSGLGFSFMLFGLTYWEAASRAKMEKTAAELFEVQQHREILLEKERKARQSAEQANATKDEFISIISHELKTPLNAIAGWARILRTMNISPGTKDLALQKIDKNLRAQASLVEQLLNYSEIISGRSNLEVENIDFSELFEDVFNQFQPLAREKNIEMTKSNELDHHLISGDRDKLKILIQNLFSNAVKFTQSGGKIETRVFENGGEICMLVKDSGRGISQEFLPYIFDRYKQADNPNTRDYGGLGLGLTISKHIANLHKGKITAYSDGKGKGSVFTVSFPINSAG